MPYHITAKQFDELIVPRIRIDEASALYILDMFRTLSQSLIGIFLPIYIFEIGRDIIVFNPVAVTNALLWVVFFFMLRSLAVVISVTLGLPLLFNHLKLKGSLVLANVLLVFSYVALFLAKDNAYLVFLAALIQGVVITFYWIPFHVFFDRKAKGKDGRYGKEVGTRIVLNKVVNMIAPVVGGFIISYMGFSTVFSISIVILLASIVPVWIVVNEAQHHKHNIKNIYKNMLFNSKYKKLTLSYIGTATDANVFEMFWPIVLIIFVASYSKIGVLSAVSALASVFSAIMVGRIIDRVGGRKVHFVGTRVNALLYIPRIFLTAPIFLYALDVVDKINGALYSIPRIAQSYEKGIKLGGSDYFVYRELALHGPMVVVFVLIVPLLALLGDWRFVFLLASVGSLMSYLISVDASVVSQRDV